MQTSFEVIDSLLRKQPAERMGFFDLPWGDTLRKWAEEEGYPTNADGHPRGAVEVFGMDLAPCGGWMSPWPRHGFEEVLEETDEWVVRRDGAGAVQKNWKHKSGTPQHVDFGLTSREIWDRDYRPHLLDLNPDRIDIGAAKANLQHHREAGRWAFFGGMFIWELLRHCLGDVRMYECLALDPDWIHDFNRVYTDAHQRHLAVVLDEVKPDGIWIYEDLGFHKGLFCSPATLEALIFPYYKEMVDFFHGYDLPVVLHSCGGVTAAMPLIVDAGFDALNPMEAKAGCDVVAFAREYGDDLAFVGGMDARIYEAADPDAIRAEVIRICTAMRDMGGRYVFGSDHSISTNVTLADFRLAADTWRQHRTYRGPA